MRALLIPVNRSEPIEEIQLPDEFNARCERMTELVCPGGYFERVSHPTRSDLVCWVDGEGLNKAFLPNWRATEVFYPYPGHFLAGAVLVTGEGWDGEDMDVIDLPEDVTVNAIGGAS